MPQGQKQIRNTEMVRNLTSDFLTNERFYLDGARLLSAVLSTHANAGGQLTWGFMGDSRQNYGTGYTTAWTETNVSAVDYLATAYGGPYVDLNGANEFLSIADAAWQEPVSEELLVWHWCNPRGVASNITIASKYDTNGNNCSWRLRMNAAGPQFEFVVNGTGNPANDVTVVSAKTPVAGTWYFVAGHYWTAGALMAITIWVAAQTDTDVTINAQVAGAPLALFNGNAPLAIGTAFNNAPTVLEPWDGYIGVGNGRISTAISDNAHVRRLLGMTQALYQ